jgi:5'-methylthioadenosine phosphorylase
MPKIGIIGGTGIYNQDSFELIKEVYPNTKYGKPSDKILIGKINGVEVAFLHRHAADHHIPPTEVPYKANIAVLKELGCDIIISPCAVGSLREDYKPGDIVIVDQFVDFTKKRDYTFFNDKAIHIAIPDPFCPQVNAVFDKVAKKQKISYHLGGTYVCIEGPRFSTRAESRMFRNFGDLVGMTLVPECQLAREMGICYCSLATVTDYDAWKEEAVDSAMVVRTMAACLDKITKLLEQGLPLIDKLPSCHCADAAGEAGAIVGKK